MKLTFWMKIARFVRTKMPKDLTPLRLAIGGLERVTNVVLIMMIVYLLFLAASLVRFILP